MKKAIIILSLLTYGITDAQVSSSLSINDTRSINDLPNFFEHGIRADFKERAVIGVPGQGAYSTNLTLAQWDNWNNSGEKHHQLNFNNGGVFYRNANPLDSQWDSWRQILMANENGNVGIGTTTPDAKLTVNGDIKINDVNTYFGSNFQTNDYSTMSFMSRAWQTVQGNNGKAFSFQTHYNSGEFGLEKMAIFYGENGKIVMAHNGGNVGIGTISPDEKLTVKGKIHTQEVKVDMNGWSDFVFKKKYNLPTLEEVEKHINEKGHLKEIPSEEEVLKNGINLGEMNAKLLQKIEEMTLYMIEQEKKNLQQSQEIELLNRKLSKIEELISSKSN